MDALLNAQRKAQRQQDANILKAFDKREIPVTDKDIAYIMEEEKLSNSEEGSVDYTEGSLIGSVDPVD
jgi:hypothetical protein